MSIHNDVKKILISNEELKIRIKELAKEIEHDYQGKKIVMICLLKGSIPFFTYLCENIDLPMEYQMMRASSYHGTNTTGKVNIINMLTTSLSGKDVLIVEDIVDTGLTLTHMKKVLLEMEPASLKIVTLLDKPVRRLVDDMNPEYVGFTIPDEFVIGFGLDFDEEYRNLPYVGILKEEKYVK